MPAGVRHTQWLTDTCMCRLIVGVCSVWCCTHPAPHSDTCRWRAEGKKEPGTSWLLVHCAKTRTLSESRTQSTFCWERICSFFLSFLFVCYHKPVCTLKTNNNSLVKVPTKIFFFLNPATKFGCTHSDFWVNCNSDIPVNCKPRGRWKRRSRQQKVWFDRW